MEGLTLSQREQVRLETLNRVLQGQMRTAEAAQLLNLSERHTWRLLAAYRKKGAAVMAHGNRGRRPANAIPEEIRKRVIELARTRYQGLNHCHLTELLTEREDLFLARSTVRSILLEAGMSSSRRRRPPRHRVRRERLPQEGMLVQIDGSPHDWLEGRGPELSLIVAIDDATGTIPWALFREQEDSHGYFLLLWGIIERRGIPLALYSDRHAIFQQRRRAGRSPEEQEPTQFGRAMGELGMSQILARSPQAKGRVERVGGTLQDRLVAELRLAGASNISEANDVLWNYLPRHNERFGVPPAQPGSAYRPLSPQLELASILCFKHRRKVAKDNTIRYEGRSLQLFPDRGRMSYAGAQVEVQERLDGSLVVCDRGQVIPAQDAPPQPAKLRFGNGRKRRRLAETRVCFARGVAADLCRKADFPNKTPAPNGRRPTPRQQARWEAVQQAKRRGLSMRAIARVLNISRTTVRKYARAPSPPVYGQGPSTTNGGPALTESLDTKP